VRQTVLLTTILVGVKWLPVYYLLTINIGLFLVGVFWSIAAGFGADESCTAETTQGSRVGFLQIQIVTLFLYMLWVMMPIVVFKVNDMMFKPDDQDDDG
jgi:4-amino-4-deoxy-L-arabinose transferase-like glycosyltransferase